MLNDPPTEERLERLFKMRNSYVEYDHETPAWLATLGQLDVERGIILLLREIESKKGNQMRNVNEMLEDVRAKNVEKAERMAIEDEQKQIAVQKDADAYVAGVLFAKLADTEKRIENVMLQGGTQVLINVAPNGPRGRALLNALAQELETLGFRCYKQPVQDWHMNDRVSFTLSVHWWDGKSKTTEFKGN